MPTNVNLNNNTDKKVIKINIIQEPYVKIYNNYEKACWAGLIAEAVYEDGSSEILVDPYVKCDPITQPGKYIVSVFASNDYQEGDPSATFIIWVLPNNVNINMVNEEMLESVYDEAMPSNGLDAKTLNLMVISQEEIQPIIRYCCSNTASCGSQDKMQFCTYDCGASSSSSSSCGTNSNINNLACGCSSQTCSTSKNKYNYSCGCTKSCGSGASQNTNSGSCGCTNSCGSGGSSNYSTRCGCTAKCGATASNSTTYSCGCSTGCTTSKNKNNLSCGCTSEVCSTSRNKNNYACGCTKSCGASQSNSAVLNCGCSSEVCTSSANINNNSCGCTNTCSSGSSQYYDAACGCTAQCSYGASNRTTSCGCNAQCSSGASNNYSTSCGCTAQCASGASNRTANCGCTADCGATASNQSSLNCGCSADCSASQSNAAPLKCGCSADCSASSSNAPINTCGCYIGCNCNDSGKQLCPDCPASTSTPAERNYTLHFQHAEGGITETEQFNTINLNGTGYSGFGIVYYETTNKSASTTASLISKEVSLNVNDTIQFDYLVSTQANYDVLTVKIYQNGAVWQTVTDSGYNATWIRRTFIANVAGTYKIEITYTKNGDTNLGQDTCWLRQIYYTTGGENKLFEYTTQTNFETHIWQSNVGTVQAS